MICEKQSMGEDERGRKINNECTKSVRNKRKKGGPNLCNIANILQVFKIKYSGTPLDHKCMCSNSHRTET